MNKKFFSRQRLEQLIHAIISHRLDYCNCVLINISKENFFKIHKFQNAAARIILVRRLRDSATEALKELHWLNIDALSVFASLR